MSFGVIGFLVLWVLFLWLVSAVVLFGIANSEGRSKHFVWWSLLGWLDLIIGAVVLLTGPTRESAE